MDKRQILYAALGYMGIVWSLTIYAAGNPFDAGLMILLSIIVIHESYPKAGELVKE